MEGEDKYLINKEENMKIVKLVTKATLKSKSR